MKMNWRGLFFIILSVFLAGQIIHSVSYAQENYISGKEAINHVGEMQTVCDIVASKRYLAKSRRQVTFIYLGQPYPNHIFTIAIWGIDRAKWPRPPEQIYQGKKICVTGKIELYKGKPEIIVNDPSQIILAPFQ